MPSSAMRGQHFTGINTQIHTNRAFSFGLNFMYNFISIPFYIFRTEHQYLSVVRHSHKYLIEIKSIILHTRKHIRSIIYLLCFLLFSLLVVLLMPLSMQCTEPNLSRNQPSIVFNSRTANAQQNVMPHVVLGVASDQEYRSTKVAAQRRTKKWSATRNPVVYQVSV